MAATVRSIARLSRCPAFSRPSRPTIFAPTATPIFAAAVALNTICSGAVRLSGGGNGSPSAEGITCTHPVRCTATLSSSRLADNCRVRGDRCSTSTRPRRRSRNGRSKLAFAIDITSRASGSRNTVSRMPSTAPARNAASTSSGASTAATASAVQMLIRRSPSRSANAIRIGNIGRLMPPRPPE